MRKKIIDKLCCPFDKSDLSLEIITYNEESRDILEGILHCDKCQRIYPVISGIPIMTPDEFREKSLEEPVIEKWKNLIKSKDSSEIGQTKSIENKD